MLMTVEAANKPPCYDPGQGILVGLRALQYRSGDQNQEVVTYWSYYRWGTWRDIPSRQGEHLVSVLLEKWWDRCPNPFLRKVLVKQTGNGTFLVIPLKVTCSLLPEFDPQTEQVRQACQLPGYHSKEGSPFDIVSKLRMLSPSTYKGQPNHLARDENALRPSRINHKRVQIQ